MIYSKGCDTRGSEKMELDNLFVMILSGIGVVTVGYFLGTALINLIVGNQK